MRPGRTETGIEDRGFELGKWKIFPQRCLIRQGKRELHLEPKQMDLLLYFLQRPQRVISRQELLEQVWPDTFVAEVALSRSVSELRKALGDCASSPTYIETIPRRGYRLICLARPLRAEVASCFVRSASSQPNNPPRAS